MLIWRLGEGRTEPETGQRKCLDAPAEAIVRLRSGRYRPPVAVSNWLAVPIQVFVLGPLGLTALLYVTLRWWDARRTGGPAITGKPGGLEITAVVLLLIGESLFLVGWVVGCVLLWVSPRWRWTDKLLGTLFGGGLMPYVWVWGPAGELCTGPSNCTSYGPPPWVGDAAVMISFLGQVAVAVWLLRRAAKQPRRTIPATPLS